MKTIAIFGATGTTGLPLTKKLIEQGFKVKALVRNVSKLGELKTHIQVVEGDVRDKDKVEETIKGSDIVISVIGHNLKTPEGLQVEATKNILNSMNRNNVKRIIDLTTAATQTPNDRFHLLNFLLIGIMSIFLYKVIADSRAHSRILEESDSQWTVIRASVLGANQSTGNFRLGNIGDHGMRFIVPRGDMIDAIIKILPDTKYFRKYVYVG